MRAIWTGAVTFGLVNVPVKLYAATESHDVSLHQVHDADGGRIKYQRVCEIDGKVVPYEHIDKAYEEDGKTVILTDDDIASLPVEKSREIEVVEFVPSDQVDPIMFEKSYYLEPDSKSAKAYALLRTTLEKSERTAIVQFSLRQKSRLGALRVRDDVLVLQGLLWDDEVRAARFPSLDAETRVTSKELDMSMALVKSFEGDFDRSKYADDYQEELRTLIDAKLEQGDALDTEATFGETEETEGGGDVLDLMEALRRSVDRSRGASDSGSGSGSGSAPKSGSGAKGASAKEPAKKPAASKGSTKKPAASKSAPARKKASA
jgi:DNA end-binding protein Ku